MAITDKVYFKNVDRISRQIDRNLPRNAFHPASLDILYEGDIFEEVDSETGEELLGFVDDFMGCGCRDAPFCGHPEKEFIRYLLELREEGLEPDGIVGVMESEFGLTAYSGDVLEFLDSAVRYLDAIEEVADTLAEHSSREEAAEVRERLVEGR